jgi:hypothetical protein
MGSEISCTQPPRIEVEVLGTAPLETVELRRGLEIIHSEPLVEEGQGQRLLLKLVWEGARRKWRARPSIWHGSLKLESGRILSVETFAFDSPDQGIVNQSKSQISWLSSTAGDPDGLFLDLETPDDALLTFETEPATFTFTLADLQDRPLVIDAGGLGQQVTAELVSRGPRPTMSRFTYLDTGASNGANAYWLRVIQRDGAMAWSSPIYVEMEP